ncbi:MAG: 5-oxoprolinase subunit PxpB [Vicinamibacterales bacterium]
MQTTLRRAGDSGLLIELADRIDPQVNARAIQIARVVEASGIAATDVVVGYRTVMVYVDPLAPDAADVEPRLARILSTITEGSLEPGALKSVPVCYDGEYAPDLQDVASFAGVPPDEIAGRHAAREYRVYVVGFVPGWAYMASVDDKIAAPRRASPRVRVPPGSVGIAAIQTGIYPAGTPGGWNLIGRCPIKPYDPDRSEPFLFHAGDRVRFHRISASEYRASTEWGDA